MKYACAWCGKTLTGRGREVSHGICVKCFAALLQKQFEFMEGLPLAGARSRAPRSFSARTGHLSAGLLQRDLQF